MRIISSVFFALLLGLSADAEPLLIGNVNVVDVDGNRVLRDRQVLVDDGVIVSVDTASAGAPPEGLATVDGRGGYLLPGLADMHVHLEYFEDPDMLWLFLANGVTLVRQMDGRPYLVDWRERIRRGELPGPEIVTAGPIIDGETPVDPEYAAAGSSRAARRIVEQQHRDGYDFIKVYHGLKPAVLNAVFDAAADKGMPVAGHVPFRVGLERILEGGRLGSIEHLDGYDDLVQPLGSPMLEGWNWRKMIMAVPVDERRLERVAHQTAESGIWNTPTLAVKDWRWLRPENLVQQQQRKELVFLPDAVVGAWNPAHWTGGRGQLYRSFGAAEFADIEQGFVNSQRIVSALHRHGVGLLAGTDTPNPFIVPGFSLHRELEHLVGAGLTPAEALAASTTNAARYLGRERELGCVAPGCRADLILVADNPLDDIRNLRTIQALLLGGRWILRDELQRHLESLAQ